MSRLRLILATLAIASLGACAKPASFWAMVPETAAGLVPAPAPAYRNAITVGSVAIGEDTATPWRSAVSPEQVRDALVQALAANQLGQPNNGRFRLDTFLLQLERPFAGFAMTVTATMAYRMINVTSGAVVYERTLKGLGTATLNDAIDNGNRLRIADQRAVRANIEQMLLDLLALPGG
ncbi:MAG: hypothetical protein ISP45_07500 [Reyranella sp.]|nr:hypothetical protein [Reyranella sp.]